MLNTLFMSVIWIIIHFWCGIWIYGSMTTIGPFPHSLQCNLYEIIIPPFCITFSKMQLKPVYNAISYSWSKKNFGVLLNDRRGMNCKFPYGKMHYMANFLYSLMQHICVIKFNTISLQHGVKILTHPWLIAHSKCSY